MPCILPLFSLFRATYSAAAVEEGGMRMAILRSSPFVHCATETPGRVHPCASSRDLRLWLDVGLVAQNASSVVRKHLPRRQLNSVERKNFFKMNYFRGKKSPVPSECLSSGRDWYFRSGPEWSHPGDFTCHISVADRFGHPPATLVFKTSTQ